MSQKTVLICQLYYLLLIVIFKEYLENRLFWGELVRSFIVIFKEHKVIHRKGSLRTSVVRIFELPFYIIYCLKHYYHLL